jgi:hypothetical protein
MKMYRFAIIDLFSHAPLLKMHGERNKDCHVDKTTKKRQERQSLAKKKSKIKTLKKLLFFISLFQLLFLFLFFFYFLYTKF